ncbi:MAG TPA: low molecular weight protein arginine phosphatase [Synergistetes bacterium]|nr:low molecular weight protein arginine phosphatase [Synergistota bacterium]
MFVCSGNTCRSPMAEGFMNRFLEESPWGGGFAACSSGTMASRGLPASEMAVKTMKEHGIDISRHRSSPAGIWIPPEDTLFFCMTRRQKMELQNIFSGRSSRIFLLGEAADSVLEPEEVPDPFGASLDNYRKIALILLGMVKDLQRSLEKDLRFSA